MLITAIPDNVLQLNRPSYAVRSAITAASALHRCTNYNELLTRSSSFYATDNEAFYNDSD